MKIIGHPWIKSEEFVAVKSLEDIKRSKASSVLVFYSLDDNTELIRYCSEQDLPFALKTSDLKYVLIAQEFGCKYILADKSEAEEFQAVAQHYLFDMQILAVINDEDEIAEYARMGVDGVIFSSHIDKK